MKTTIIGQDLYVHYDLERIIRDALLQELDPTPELYAYLEETYRITPTSKFLIIGAYLGRTYAENRDMMKHDLMTFAIHSRNTLRIVICLPIQEFVLCILDSSETSIDYDIYQKKFLNEWGFFIPEHSIFVAQSCTGLKGFSSVLDASTKLLDWNLVFESRVVLNQDKLASLNMTALKYPTELDGEVEKALLQRNTHDFTACFHKLYTYCRQEIHTPTIIKSMIIRFSLVVAHVIRSHGIKQQELAVFYMTHSIINAIYWVDIWNSLYTFALPMLKDNEEEKAQSLLVIEARRLMLRYYSKGITLEEIANKLHVSEEYLSTIFKKETGETFSETVRELRINKIKELLISSPLKINVIAKLAGYSDGKYMSRVFKDVTGMSPNEYRKARTN